jgi:diadenosine hexaphosphate hydrolase (ATP-forming)
MIEDSCAGGLVFLNDRLLILERYNGVWLFPKGHIDPGETAPIAAIREVEEESGLKARILEPLGETTYTFTENGAEHFKTVQWFLMEALSNQIKLEKDFFRDYRLVDESGIGRLSFAHDREMARRAFDLYPKWRNAK